MYKKNIGLNLPKYNSHSGKHSICVTTTLTRSNPTPNIIASSCSVHSTQGCQYWVSDLDNWLQGQSPTQATSSSQSQLWGLLRRPFTAAEIHMTDDQPGARITFMILSSAGRSHRPTIRVRTRSRNFVVSGKTRKSSLTASQINRKFWAQIYFNW